MTSRSTPKHAATQQIALAPPPFPALSGAAQIIPQADGTATLRLDMTDKSLLEPFGGSESSSFNVTMLKEVLDSILQMKGTMDPDSLFIAVNSGGAALKAFAPTDAIEGMLAAQAVALHFGAMDCLRRAVIPGQPFEIAARLRKDAANMMRTMTDMLDALDRKRGKGPQVVRVERVVVQDGGQAIVGNVTPGARGEVQNREGELHA